MSVFLGSVMMILVAFTAQKFFQARQLHVRPPHVERITVSWYGPGFYGRTTSNGEIYTGKEFTAAHTSLPFGQRVQLKSRGREVVVRVNDRGPFDLRSVAIYKKTGKSSDLSPHKVRDLDISDAAADALGIKEKGVAKIEAWVVPE